MRNMYVLQPYEVGSKKSKSLALVIPAKVVKEYNIDTSTVFALQRSPNTKTIALHQTSTYPIITQFLGQKTITDQSFENSKQQPSVEK